MFRKTLAILFSVCLIATSLCLGTTAVGQTVEGGNIKIDSVEAYAGNEIIVGINIENNPGIMALTVSISYDSSRFNYLSFDKGNVFTDYTVAAQPENNRIRFVVCESKNKTQNGAMIYIRFEILENVSVGTYPITLDYSLGDFSNYAMDYIMPTVENGGVTVLHCDHPESEWVLTDPTFETEGNKSLVCKVCGKAIEKISIAKLVYGDLSRDGVLKSNDLVGLRRLILGTLSNENYEELVANVNGDDAVDIRDLVRLKKYFVDLSVDLGKPEDNTQSNVQSTTQSNVQSSDYENNTSSENTSRPSQSANSSRNESCSSMEQNNDYSESVTPNYSSSKDTTTSNP